MTAFSDETGTSITCSIEHDGFIGTVQGHYVTREGKRGVVLQQVGTRVVHVYGEKWIKPALSASPVAQEPYAFVHDHEHEIIRAHLLKTMLPKAAARYTKPLYEAPPATSAGVGADEIVAILEENRRRKIEWLNGPDGPMPKELTQEAVANAILALLSRAGTKSFQEETQTSKPTSVGTEAPRTECPNCHDANKYGDYEGPCCNVCGGVGTIPTCHDCGAGAPCDEHCPNHDGPSDTPIADSSEAGRGGSQALREVVVKYLHDGRLQTLERFRKEARAALSAPVGEPVASLNASIDRFALAQARRIVEENAIPFATISGGYHRLDLPTAAYKALKEALYPHPPAPAVGPDVREALANAIEALRPFARAAENIPGNLPDDLWTHCASYRFDMPEETYQRLKDAGVPVLDKTMNLSLWIDGHPLGDFRRAKAAYDVLSALTRPLGGFVQGSIADGGQCNEQSGKQPSLRTSPGLLAALGRAKAHVMTPAERYEQRRSFTRGMCPSNRDYAEWCTEVDKLLPPLPAVAETDADAQRDDGLVSGGEA